ncbi:MAG: hypothetical protein EBZ62_09520, partial [Sphingobacteriia bacterium]|nr:hypothetical protein [Sphingobacteriia bacterium]
PYFECNRMALARGQMLNRQHDGLDSLVVLMILQGMAVLDHDGGQTVVRSIETLMLPAAEPSYRMYAQEDTVWLEIYLPLSGV